MNASDFSWVKNEMSDALHAVGSSDQINMKKRSDLSSTNTDESAPADKSPSCVPRSAAEFGRSGSYFNHAVKT